MISGSIAPEKPRKTLFTTAANGDISNYVRELTTVFVLIFGTCCGDSCVDDKWIDCPRKAADNPFYNCGKWGYKQLCCASCKNVKMDPECPDGEQWSCRKGAQEEPAYYCRPDKKNCC